MGRFSAGARRFLAVDLGKDRATTRQRFGHMSASVGYTASVTIQLFDKMSASNRRLLFLLFGVAMWLGVFEDVFGRADYSGDAISYLNIVRAVHAGDWKLALSSYWGLGYPLLLSLITPLFPATPEAEWIAVHVANGVIYAATFLCFFWMVWVAARSLGMERYFKEEGSVRFLLAGALAIFLSIELSLDNVSRVGPDMLVSCLLFWAIGLLLRLREQPSAGRAILLGLVLGLGYVVKSIFLPLTLLFALVAILAMWRQRGRFVYLALILVFSGVFAAPYIAGMSWAQGHLTYGDSGSLNYIWNVNKLEPGGLWQGQPPQFGTPVHPTKMISEMPHLYTFDGPFAVTFAPFFNPPYYYQGVRRFFSLKAQIHAIGGNVLRLSKMVRLQIVFFALLVCWVLSRSKVPEERKSWMAIKSLWPVVLICCCGIGVYLLVILETRYIASFVAMLFVVLLFAISAELAGRPAEGSGLRSTTALTWILVAGCGFNLLANEKDSVRDVLGNTIYHRIFSNSDQWKAGLYLAQTGLRPGDKVAVMTDLVSASLSTWAYKDNLQIVGILGGSLLETQTIDYDAFWQSSPEKQKQILENFHLAGARVVVGTSTPVGPGAEGWESIPGTKFWVYRF